MNIQRLRAIYRAGFGLLTLTALAVQYFTSRTLPTFSPVNYFSYMTNLSNLLGAIVFLWFGVSTRRTLGMEQLRGAATLYLTVVFVVYVLLLSDIPLGILRPWVNVVLHYIMPVAALFDWAFSPPQRRLEVRLTLTWLGLPLVFVIYSLIRGASIGWYPYPFLDPTKVGGYAVVATYCVSITVVFVLFGILLTWFVNRLVPTDQGQLVKNHHYTH